MSSAGSLANRGAPCVHALPAALRRLGTAALWKAPGSAYSPGPGSSKTCASISSILRARVEEGASLPPPPHGSARREPERNAEFLTAYLGRIAEGGLEST